MMIILDLFTVDCIGLVVDVETYYIFCVFKIHTVYHHITCNLRSFLGSLLPHHPYHPCPFFEKVCVQNSEPVRSSVSRSFNGKIFSKPRKKLFEILPEKLSNPTPLPKQHPKTITSFSKRRFSSTGRGALSFLEGSLPRFLCFRLQPSQSPTPTFTRVTAPKKLVTRATEFLWANILYSFFTITSMKLSEGTLSWAQKPVINGFYKRLYPLLGTSISPPKKLHFLSPWFSLFSRWDMYPFPGG